MTVQNSISLRTGTLAPASGNRLRVLVVDDSVVMRRLIARILESDPVFEILGTACNGLEALAKVDQLRPDVVTLDVEMPELDGLGALQLILKAFPKTRVVMCSSLTERGATCTIDALLAGASDYVTKHHSGEMSTSAYETLREELTFKIKRLFPNTTAGTAVLRRDAPFREPKKILPSHAASNFIKKPRPQILAIGVSTGGPSALAEIFPMIPSDFPLPIVIVQHMPPLFTHLLAERLTKLSSIRVLEATRGMKVERGMALIAPGDFHMRLVRKVSGVEVELNQEERENSCRPAVDVLFRSVAEIYSGAVMAVILTGMGQDGLLGVRCLKNRGASVIVQDNATSVVWGMPGAVADASLADSVLPLREIIPTIVRDL